MSSIVLILARKNSKRLKNKNFKSIKKNFYLIDYTLKTANKIKNIDNILISTDDEKIINHVNENYKNIITLIRPKYLARGKSSSYSSSIHAIKWYSKNISKLDNIILLQPTSPFRVVSKINLAFDLFFKNKEKSIVSVSPYKFLKKNKSDVNKITIKQKQFYINGNFYITNLLNLKKFKSFHSKKSSYFINNTFKESIDIDTRYDWLQFRQLIR